MDDGSQPAPAWEDRAVNRSLATARARQVELARRLVGAARALMWESKGPGFTVSQVVERAGTSLKSFYRCFSGKDELLVALYEDDARRGAAALAAMVDQAPDQQRLRSAVVGLFSFLTIDGRLPYAATLVSEHLRLTQSRPAQLRELLRPFLAVLEAEVERAGAAGTLERAQMIKGGQPDPTWVRLQARTLFHLVIAHLHAVVWRQIDDPPQKVAEDLWMFTAGALGAKDP